jgi:hypothetical protein
MRFISPKNHAKIFEEMDGNVYLWKVVEEYIWDYYKKNMKLE